MKIPQAFISTLVDYLYKMEELGKIPHADFEGMAMTVFSATFGYTFLKASFDNKLSEISPETFIKNSVSVFVKGVS